MYPSIYLLSNYPSIHLSTNYLSVCPREGPSNCQGTRPWLFRVLYIEIVCVNLPKTRLQSQYYLVSGPKGDWDTRTLIGVLKPTFPRDSRGLDLRSPAHSYPFQRIPHHPSIRKEKRHHCVLSPSFVPSFPTFVSSLVWNETKGGGPLQSRPGLTRDGTSSCLRRVTGFGTDSRETVSSRRWPFSSYSSFKSLDS